MIVSWNPQVCEALSCGAICILFFKIPQGYLALIHRHPLPTSQRETIDYKAGNTHRALCSPCRYLFRPYSKHVCSRVNIIWVLFVVVGISSAYFHATLSLVGQLLDELAILWSLMVAFVLWTPKWVLALGPFAVERYVPFSAPPPPPPLRLRAFIHIFLFFLPTHSPPPPPRLISRSQCFPIPTVPYLELVLTNSCKHIFWLITRNSKTSVFSFKSTVIFSFILLYYSHFSLKPKYVSAFLHYIFAS